MKNETKVISLQLDLKTYEELIRISKNREQKVQGIIRLLIKKFLHTLEEN